MARLTGRIVVFVALLCAGISGRAALEARGQAPTGQETAVREVVKKYVDAREKTNPEAIGALFTADADQLTSSGEWRKGRDAIVRGTIASSRQTGGTRTITIETVRFPAPGVALADGRYEIAGGSDGTRRMWTTFLLTRTSSGWAIAAIRNMLPAPLAAPASPPK
ncbi:MAG: SgcJ/EcaC family oxidoreductase [Acidobacteriota bacterium]